MSDRFILMGHPVGHSLSPVIHAAAYRELARAGHYNVLDCPDEAAVARAVESVRSGELRGANVTVPWKREALALADRVDESARAVGAANVLARDAEGCVTAYNTDAPGLATELTAVLAAAEKTAAETTAVVIGNGGAALGAVLACRLAGVSEVRVVARRFTEAVPRAEWPGLSQLERLGATAWAWPLGAPLRGSAFEGAGLIVQATSAGMQGADAGDTVAALVPWAQLARVAAYDLVYKPEVTPFLLSAREAGHIARGGLGMLVAQAALAIEIWWGERPPLAPLMAAAERALGR